MIVEILDILQEDFMETVDSTRRNSLLVHETHAIYPHKKYSRQR